MVCGPSHVQDGDAIGQGDEKRGYFRLCVCDQLDIRLNERTKNLRTEQTLAGSGETIRIADKHFSCLMTHVKSLS